MSELPEQRVSLDESVDAKPAEEPGREFDVSGLTVNEQLDMAARRDINPEFLRALADLKDPEIDLELSKNPKTPTNVLSELAESGDARVVSAVAGNPNSGQDVREKALSLNAGRVESGHVTPMASSGNHTPAGMNLSRYMERCHSREASEVGQRIDVDRGYEKLRKGMDL
ncbi:hypothetical protein A3709_18790 [Halioglobus sp. HI00S01]|uniref:hypothetical protein n=1 Tax=Halioglobus sp. HI00S01 TaxID=1822214 RepID=UPI0007C38381|nr:hypothetical protein [Halioglobus sp. HI00S01]KZX57672.1 hypothetical protein A3709_18790 [Halioglobus sp. HI00S01]